MKKLDFTIRRATKKDQDTLADFRYKLDMVEMAHNPHHPKTTKAEVRNSVSRYLRSRKYFFYIAEVGGKPVGFSAASIKFHERTKKVRGTFEAIWVEPQYRKQGVARALSEVRLKMLRKLKPEKITVYIRPKNQASIHNIEQLGGKHTLNVYTFDTKQQ